MVMPNIIPAPNERTLTPGVYDCSKLVAICPLGLPAAGAAKLCMVTSSCRLGLRPTDPTADMANMMVWELLDGHDGFADEEYELVIHQEGIRIQAGDEAGLFYGCQTLRQLIGLDATAETRPTLPCLTIRDRPRFSWRGFMLDESRHFFGKAYIKKLLDWMATVKLNRFHWHLTDEPAWRIEILEYPRLTGTGAQGSYSDPDAPIACYTQSDIREIVAYAIDRHITIVPEIDMPGHATAANRAYPEFSGGGSKRCPEFTFNPGPEATYTYLQNILREVADLFPGQWLHIGADEVHFGNEQWHTNPAVQARMRKEGLADLKAVENYFVRRMAAFVVEDLGKTPMGWDEIVGSGIPPGSAAVMWWRHNLPDVLNAAYTQGYGTILCPRIPCYFDFVQDESHVWGRRWPSDGFGTIRQLHSYPFARDLPQEPARLLGIQANLWTETVKGANRADFMSFPRLFALAEAAWTQPERKEWDGFTRAMAPLFTVLRDRGTHYFDYRNPKATPEIPGVAKYDGNAQLEEERQAGIANA